MFFLGIIYTLLGIIALIFLDDKTGGKLNELINKSSIIMLIAIFCWPAAALWLSILWMVTPTAHDQQTYL